MGMRKRIVSVGMLHSIGKWNCRTKEILHLLHLFFTEIKRTAWGKEGVWSRWRKLYSLRAEKVHGLKARELHCVGQEFPWSGVEKARWSQEAKIPRPETGKDNCIWQRDRLVGDREARWFGAGKDRRLSEVGPPFLCFALSFPVSFLLSFSFSLFPFPILLTSCVTWTVWCGVATFRLFIFSVTVFSVFRRGRVCTWPGPAPLSSPTRFIAVCPLRPFSPVPIDWYKKISNDSFGNRVEQQLNKMYIEELELIWISSNMALLWFTVSQIYLTFGLNCHQASQTILKSSSSILINFSQLWGWGRRNKQTSLTSFWKCGLWTQTKGNS